MGSPRCRRCSHHRSTVPLPTRLRGLRLRTLLVVVLCSIVATAATVATNSRVVHAEETFRDFASDAFGNPWDYNDNADIILGDGPVLGVQDAQLSDGALRFRATGAGYVSPLWAGYPGALDGILDGVARPIDASRYARIAMRVTSSAPLSAGIRWYTCPDGALQESCQGGFGFEIAPGTNRYDFPMVAATNDPALRAPWSGQIRGIRLAVGGSAQVSIDWLSIYGGDAPGDAGPSSPAGRVLDPDIEGGLSLSATLRGREWDMGIAEDVTRTYNVTGGIRNGVYEGANAGPTRNDPTIVLNLACRTFRAEQFHRFTVEFAFDGPFNLEDRPGGGMMQRLIWRIAGTPITPDGRDLQNSEDMVIYPGRRRYSVDLVRNPPVAITDPSQIGPRIGWLGEIEHVRFDPNEDPGPRTWRVDSVKLAADDLAAAGSTFAVTWTDTNFAPGGLATVALSSSPDGANAEVIADRVAVQQGVNRTPWVVRGSGKRWVVLTIRRGATESRTISTGPLVIGSMTPTNQANARGVDGTRDGEPCPATGASPARAAAVKASTKTKASAKPKTKTPAKKTAKKTTKR